MVMITMPKKKPSTDGRSNRFTPMKLEEMESIRDRLKKLAGVYTAICSEMAAASMETIKVDGRVGVEEGLRNLGTMARRSTGILAGGELNLD